VSVRLLAVSALLALVAGCASSPEAPVDFNARPEKQLYVTLKEVKATDDQRLKIQDAYDRFDAQYKVQQAKARDLIAQWRAIDRRDPAFTELTRGLSERWAALAAERLLLESGYEQEVAAVLDPGQWKTWQEWMMPHLVMSTEEQGQREYGRRGGGRGP
jgi:hypothetical protein